MFFIMDELNEKIKIFAEKEKTFDVDLPISECGVGIKIRTILAARYILREKIDDWGQSYERVGFIELHNTNCYFVRASIPFDIWHKSDTTQRQTLLKELISELTNYYNKRVGKVF